MEKRLENKPYAFHAIKMESVVLMIMIFQIVIEENNSNWPQFMLFFRLIEVDFWKCVSAVIFCARVPHYKKNITFYFNGLPFGLFSTQKITYFHMGI